jgi:galactose-1-phosphate uridylyltransferase
MDSITLRKNTLPGDIDIHSDLLSVLPAALSRRRGLKVGKALQTEMQDNKGPKECILCHPGKKARNLSLKEDIIPNRVADFLNDFPYLPADQRIIFLWHEEPTIRENCLHKFKLADLRKMELFWLLKGCLTRGKAYRNSQRDNLLRLAPDLMGMVVGFNLGSLAGQSQPHIHAQYGWEVVLNPRRLSQKQLALYYEELQSAGLVLHGEKDNDAIKVIVPWTPMGQFAVDLHFSGKHDICDMTDEDVKIFAVLGHAIIQKYLSLGIQNLNIVFTNSPYDKQLEPLIIHFVPRANLAALYEIKGVNVVDTPPSMIVEEFRHQVSGAGPILDWSELIEQAKSYDPDTEFIQAIQ